MTSTLGGQRYAYSLPETATLFLILPAMFIVVLALTARRSAEVAHHPAP